MESTNCWMHVKSTSATPSLIVVGVTPVPSAVDTGAGPFAVVGVVDPLLPLLLLPHAAHTTRIATTNSRHLRMRFPPARADGATVSHRSAMGHACRRSGARRGHVVRLRAWEGS